MVQFQAAERVVITSRNHFNLTSSSLKHLQLYSMNHRFKNSQRDELCQIEESQRDSAHRHQHQMGERVKTTHRPVIRHRLMAGQLQSIDAFISNDPDQTRFMHGSSAAASPSSRHCRNTACRASAAGTRDPRVTSCQLSRRHYTTSDTTEGARNRYRRRDRWAGRAVGPAPRPG